MPFASGKRLGPYEILAPLGAGGMGEVYRARDTRLGREVAVKLLPEELARDPERVSRFEREARSASALSHAHVVAVYDVGREAESFYIVTEIVPGGNLRDVLDRGAVPLRRALDLAVQVASGLAEAHESGIVHRDLKPENILLTKPGDAKIADFGLAKLAERASAGFSQLPTSDGLKTSEGVVMGTVAYMSPEQAGGREVDYRSDQFAFGSIFYEMLTGLSPFRRSSPGETMAAVLRDEPAAVRSLQPAVPAPLAWILERCLAKAPTDRYTSTRDLAKELTLVRDHLSELSGTTSAAPGVSRVRPNIPWLLPLVAGIALGAVAAVLAFLLRRPASTSSPVIRFSLTPPAGAQYHSEVDTVNLAVSPDGTRVAFIATDTSGSKGAGGSVRPVRKVWVRSLAETEPRALAGTDGATSVFWSPDGKSVAFATESQLKRVDLAGGSVLPICDVPSSFGLSGSWGDGAILFASVVDGVLYRVSPDGGSPSPFLKPDLALWPTFLPDGKSFLFVAGRKEGETELRIAALDRPARSVGPISSRVEYVEPGFLLFAREGALFAERFDAKAGALRGPARPVAPAVYNFYSSRWADFSVSRNGTLAYASRGDISALTWFDRAGKVLGEVGTAAGDTRNLSISTDGASALFDRTRTDLGTFDIWMVDLDRGVETRITSDPNTECCPLWLRDGKHIVYSVAQGYFPRLVRRSLAGGVEEPLLPIGPFQEAMSVTPDGKALLLGQSGKAGIFGLWMLPLEGAREPVSVATSPSDQPLGQLSPDGRWIAFLSNESGQHEAYVAAVGPAEQRLRVSTSGAERLRWSRDGKEIFYTTPDRRLFSARITTSPSLRIAASVPLFNLPPQGWKGFDVSPDGRFLASVPKVSIATEPLNVVTNIVSTFER